MKVSWIPEKSYISMEDNWGELYLGSLRPQQEFVSCFYQLSEAGSNGWISDQKMRLHTTVFLLGNVNNFLAISC